MKRLTVTYDGRTLVDQDVAQFSWQETDDEIKITGRLTARKSLGEVLLGDLAKMQRQPPPAALRTASVAASEPVVVAETNGSGEEPQS